MNAITTWSGIHFDLENPTPEMVRIEDIAHALSHICHWGGHSRGFFSVAQHSLLVSRHADSDLALWGLLHDSAEAYLGDISRPLKRVIPQFKDLELRVMEVVAAKFGLPWPEPHGLKQIDNFVLCMEARDLMPANVLLTYNDGSRMSMRVPELPCAMTPGEARAHFLSMYHTLTEVRV